MTEETHPLGDFIDNNAGAISMLFLYTHPEKNSTNLTGEDLENWLCELLDEGMRVVYNRVHQDMQARDEE